MREKVGTLKRFFFHLLVVCPGGIFKLYRDIMYVKVSGATGKRKLHANGLFPSNNTAWTGILNNVFFSCHTPFNDDIKLIVMLNRLVKEVHFNVLKYV